MHIQFCGAAGEVTGSCTKLETDNTTLLIDCGLFQGNKFAEDKNYDPFPFKPEEVDAVVLTHAHLDHCGRLPKLVNEGFVGKIYATDATRDIAALILLDSAGIIGDEAERHGHPTLYTQEDVLHTMNSFTTLPYDKSVKIAQDITITLRNAGHVLGSSFIEIKGENKTVIFSGDIGNYPVPLLPQAEDLPLADALVLESTYGDKTHASYREGVELLEQAIRDTIRDRGVLLIPAFSLERTQELLTVIDKALEAHRIPQISAYLDGPLGIKISRIYDRYSKYYNKSAQLDASRETDHSVVKFPSLFVTETAEQSKMINDIDPPKLIIAGSGMMQGGRIVHHLKKYLPNESTRLFIPGHQVSGSLGRKLLDGERSIDIHGEHVEVNAKIICTHAFSSHMDKNQLIDWIKTMSTPPKAIFLNHGDEDARASLAKDLKDKLGHLNVYIPSFQQGYNLSGQET